jgi:hypothetical protein
MDRQPRIVVTASTLAALALLSCTASLLLAGCGGNSPTGPQSTTPAGTRFNADGSISLGVRTMYAVKSTDPTGDTGNKVCAKVGKQCLGYTDFSLSSCLAFHPDAASVSDLDGARAGFYCNGLPQGGVCAREINTCHICAQCNTNMECDTVVGALYRETFVECK